MTTARKVFMSLFFLMGCFCGAGAQNQFRTIWAPVTSLYKGSVNDIVFDSSGHMFICADEMYISNDSGKTGSTFLRKKATQSFVGPENSIYVSAADGLFRWVLSNSHWTKLTGIIPDGMAFGKNGTSFIGSDSGLFYSSNSTDWTQIKDSDLDSAAITGFCVDAAGRIYAAGYLQQPPYVSSPPAARLYFTDDNGATWRKYCFADSLHTTFSSAVFVTSDGKILFAISSMAFISEDDGHSWKAQGTAHVECRTTILRHDTLYAISSLGQLLRSADYGESWEMLYQTPAGGLRCVEVLNSGQMYLSTASGLLISNDHGKTWKQTLYVNVTVPALCIAFGWDGNPIIGTENGVYRSTDGGETWQESGLQGISVVGLTKNPNGYLFSAMVDSGVYRSGDTAKSWNKLEANFATSIPAKSGLVAIDSTGTIYYAIANQIFKSTDDGGSWGNVFTFPIPYVRILSVSRGQNIFAVLDSIGILRSTDGGINWNDAGKGLPYKVVTSFVTSGDYLFAAYKGVYRTTENEMSWQLAGLKDFFVEKLSTDQEGNLFAFTSASGTPGKEIYLSTDLGESWNKIDCMLTCDDLVSIEIDSGYIFAVTKDGVLLKGTGKVTSVPSGSVPIPTSFALHQNYPNPFNPTTNIEYRIANSGFVSLKVYDVLGREVATLLNEVRKPGGYQITFDARGLASGVYFYRLTAGGFSQVKKMLLTK